MIFIKVFMHFVYDRIVLNNSADELADVEVTDDFKQFFMFKFDSDFLYPAA
jgi:hypothetical protein